MARIGTMMDIGKRSLMNSQTGLQTVSHNIANKDVEGFSRQRVEFQTEVPQITGNTAIGRGAKTSAIRRINNPFLEKQLQDESAKLGLAKGRSDYLGRVEMVFNEQVNRGLNQFVGRFFNAFRELANNPENMSIRTLVRETGNAVTQDFKRVNGQLKSIQNEIDGDIVNQVTEINAKLSQIASLNHSIVNAERGEGAFANDDRDRRDQLLKDLGESMNIKFFENGKGDVTVQCGNVILVSGEEAGKIAAERGPAEGAKRDGSMGLYFQKTEFSPIVEMTRFVTGGQLGAGIEARDHVINGMLDQVDNLAYSMADHVNTVHQMGYDKYGKQGNNFFTPANSALDYSEKITLDKDILDDVWKTSAGASPNSPGDNRIANQISSLEFQKLMGNGSGTYDDFYNGMVGSLGVQTKDANSRLEHQEGTVKQLKNLRESVSGVSLDEEATKIIEYQKTFDASAKIIKTADEMFNTILDLKR